MKDIIVKDGSLFIMPNSAQRAENIVSEIYNLVKETEAENININLSEMNMFSALKVAMLTAAKGLTLNPKNKYNFIVNSEIVLKQMQILKLSNTIVNVQEEETITANNKKLSVKI